jgi:hypothetical protein
MPAITQVPALAIRDMNSLLDDHYADDFNEYVEADILLGLTAAPRGVSP